jgi:hypothetical protein
VQTSALGFPSELGKAGCALAEVLKRLVLFWLSEMVAGAT